MSLTMGKNRLFNRVDFELDACGIILCARMIFVETMLNILETVKRVPIDYTFHTSPYWGQAMTYAIRTALDSGRKYILFFDGDSVWETEDLKRMYRLIETTPGIDAICPVEADRGGENPLCFNWQAGPNKIEYDMKADVMPVVHTHCGLTIIKADVFRKMPQPWFVGIPGRDGSWDREAGKIDDDTFFWLKFNRMGFKVLQCNDIVIGHMQNMIRWQTPDGVYAQGVAEFRTIGKPPICRTPTVESAEETAQRNRARDLLFHAAGMLGIPAPKFSEPRNTSPVEKADAEPRQEQSKDAACAASEPAKLLNPDAMLGTATSFTLTTSEREELDRIKDHVYEGREKEILSNAALRSLTPGSPSENPQ